MKYLLLLIGISASAHNGMHAPPIDVTNATGRSHSGFGNFGIDDYEASEKLKKSCTDADMRENAAGVCQLPADKNEARLLAKQISAPIVLPKLQKYAAAVLHSELNLSDPDNKLPRPSCANEPVPAPQVQLRINAMRPKNLYSATILNALYQDMRPASGPYLDRLKMNYPLLFDPRDRSERLLNLIKKEVGSVYKDQGTDKFAHKTNMTALMAKLDVSADLQRKLDQEIMLMKGKYAHHLRESLKGVCSLGSRVIAQKHPGIFQQAILDMSPEERKMANLFLCSQDYYYDESKHDSDCDGVPDKSDPDPRNAFVPRAKHDVEGSANDDPPFGGDYKYKLEQKDSRIIVKRKISLNFGNLSEDKRKMYIDAMDKCMAPMKEKFKATFAKLAEKNPAYRGKSAELDVEIAASDNGVGDFNVHKCWCSTCYVKTREALFKIDSWTLKSRIAQDLRWVGIDSSILSDAYIPKDTCAEDLTPAMKAAMVNKKLNPNQQAWFQQQDAVNLVYSTAPSCQTLQHEVMHKLGLGDEYLAEYYPFNRVGPHDSLLSGGYEVYERHVSAILSPKKCEAQ
jgi:hypothetical protein